MEERAREYLRNILIARETKKEARAKLVRAEHVESRTKDEMLSWMDNHNLMSIAVDDWLIQPSATKPGRWLTLRQLDSLDDEVMEEA